jgi:anti-sigma B factor antagonist
VPREGHAPDRTVAPGSSPRSGERIDDLPFLEVTGELDLAVAPWLGEQIDALFADGAHSLVVDLSGATFLDSTALGVLVGAVTTSKERGGRIHLVVTEPQILRVLSITGLSDAFSLHERRAHVPGARTQP